MKCSQIPLRICAICLCLLFCLPLLAVSASAEAATPSMDEARAVWFSHLESGKLVASKAADTSVGAGSSVKVMSGLLLCELYVDHLYDPIVFDDDMWSAVEKYGGHILKGLQKYDTFAAYDLLYAALCGGFNNAYYMLAYYITGGSIEAFTTAMNARAQEIGMTSTYFEDPTGFAGASRTTARDMALLAKEAYKNQNYMTLCDLNNYEFTSENGKEYRFSNNNALICQYTSDTKYYLEYCHGMSAGYTPADGNCVVTIAKHAEETYICVVLGGAETATEKFGYCIANRLIKWVYATYAYVPILTPDTNICTVPVTVSDHISSVRVRAKDTLHAYLPKDVRLGTDVTYSIRLTNTELEAPFEDGAFVGYVSVIYEGRVIGTASLYTVGGAERSTIVSSLKAIKAWLGNRAVIAGAIFFIVSLIAWIVVEYVLWRRRRHRWDKYFSDKMQLPDSMTRRSADPNRLREKSADMQNAKRRH